MIQDFLSHGISIPIGSSNKFTEKLVKMLHQNCKRCGLIECSSSGEDVSVNAVVIQRN